MSAKKLTVVKSIEQLQKINPFPLNLCDTCALKDNGECVVVIRLDELRKLQWKHERFSFHNLIYKCNMYEGKTHNGHSSQETQS